MKLARNMSTSQMLAVICSTLVFVVLTGQWLQDGYKNGHKKLRGAFLISLEPN